MRKYSSEHKEEALLRRNRVPLEERQRNRRTATLKQYGLTLEDYAEILSAQEGVCAICMQKETQRTRGEGLANLAVDHDAATGTVRGLLCAQCNQAIGKFRHEILLLESATSYLRRHL